MAESFVSLHCQASLGVFLPKVDVFTTFSSWVELAAMGKSPQIFGLIKMVKKINATVIARANHL